LAAIIVAGIIIGAWFYFMGIPNKTNDIENYGKWELIQDNNLLIFPENIEKKALNYNSYYRDGIFGTSYIVYLECGYDEKTYEMEKNRLQELIINVQEDMNLLYSEEGYNYPAYIAMNVPGDYEYALLVEEEQKIVYVAARKVGEEKVDDIVPEIYWPISGWENIDQLYYDGYCKYN